MREALVMRMPHTTPTLGLKSAAEPEFDTGVRRLLSRA